MDINITELKTMKAKQLKRLIQEAIASVLNEDPEKAKNLELKANQLRQQAINIDKQATAEKEKDLKQDTQATVAEGEIDEMARLAKGYKVADPNFDASQYANKRISGVSLADIIEYIKDNPGAEKSSLQSHFGFVRPQIANAIINALLSSGILVKLTASGEEETPTLPGETAPIQATEPEDMFMGNAENPLSMYFDKEPNNDGTEDFNDDEEPTTDDLELTEPIAGSISDEDYEAFMKYDDLNNRLDATKSNITKLRKNKGNMSTDIEDRPSTELTRLRALKVSLEERIEKIIASSSYLKAKINKEKPTPAPIKPEDLEIEPLDEWTIGKMQYYAGIKK